MAGEGSVVEGEDVDKFGSSQSSANTFTLEVLQIIKESQQTHGLRHGDFQRYRQYCARRIRRIRKSLHFAQGTKHKVQPKKITEALLTDTRYLYLPLVDAERSWAYAMQLKAEANTEPRKKFHMVNRLKKAVQHAEALASLCESDKCDARTKLEASAYKAWMKGSLDFEKENWKSAIELFNSAKTIYEKLGSAFADEVKEIYLQRVEEISPSIRYCAYNIGDESAIEDLKQMRLKTGREDPLTSRLDELIEKTREKQTTSLSEVSWRGRSMPIKTEQVRLFLLSLPESEKQISEADTSDSKLSIYESLLKELIDAQQSLRDEMKEDPTFRAALRGQQNDERVPATVYLHTYLVYIKQTKTIERNLIMIDNLESAMQNKPEEGKKVTKPQDLARLYDVVIQTLVEIPNLPGLQDDTLLSQEIGTKVQCYKAFRCFYIAQTYAAAKKWTESIALYEQVLKYSKQALDGFKQISEDTKKEKASLDALMKEVVGLKFTCHASSILDSEEVSEKVTKPSSKNKQVPLAERLDEYKEDPSLTRKNAKLIQFPPDFEPISCKPLFFDLALSKVEFPSLEDKMEQRKQGGGLTGFVKGWLWGGGKN